MFERYNEKLHNSSISRHTKRIFGIEKQNWTHDEALAELVTHYLKTQNKRSDRF